MPRLANIPVGMMRDDMYLCMYVSQSDGKKACEGKGNFMLN